MAEKNMIQIRFDSGIAWHMEAYPVALLDLVRLDKMLFASQSLDLGARAILIYFWNQSKFVASLIIFQFFDSCY